MRGKQPRLDINIKIPSSLSDLGYTAGLLDGEGSVNMYKTKSKNNLFRVQINIVNTDKRAIDWLYNKWG